MDLELMLVIMKEADVTACSRFGIASLFGPTDFEGTFRQTFVYVDRLSTS